MKKGKRRFKVPSLKKKIQSIVSYNECKKKIFLTKHFFADQQGKVHPLNSDTEKCMLRNFQPYKAFSLSLSLIAISIKKAPP